MSTAVFPSAARRRFRFFGCVVVVFLFQVALIVWLSDRTEHRSRAARNVPIISLAGPESIEDLQQKFQAAETAVRADFDRALAAVKSGDYGSALVKLRDLALNPALTPEQQQAVRDVFGKAHAALENPALFALPNPESFSGEAWMSSPPMTYRAFDWNEAPRWLPLQLQPLEIFLADLFPGRARSEGTPTILSKPELNEPGMLRLKFLPSASALQVFSPEPDIIPAPVPELPAWPHSDLLTNSVVQVLVDAEGKAFSVTLLGGSGLKAADDHALRMARDLKYKPAVIDGENTAAPTANRWAQLVFEWHTTPLPAAAPPGGTS